MNDQVLREAVTPTSNHSLATSTRILTHLGKYLRITIINVLLRISWRCICSYISNSESELPKSINAGGGLSGGGISSKLTSSKTDITVSGLSSGGSHNRHLRALFHTLQHFASTTTPDFVKVIKLFSLGGKDDDVFYFVAFKG